MQLERLGMDGIDLTDTFSPIFWGKTYGLSLDKMASLTFPIGFLLSLVYAMALYS